MDTWIAGNWWVLWGIVAAIAFAIYLVKRRGGEESTPVRVLYALVPSLDPNSEVRQKLSPTAIALIAVGVILFVVAFVLLNRDI
jgi:drug/metabolite transporter (DMT)-like permease